MDTNNNLSLEQILILGQEEQIYRLEKSVKNMKRSNRVKSIIFITGLCAAVYYGKEIVDDLIEDIEFVKSEVQTLKTKINLHISNEQEKVKTTEK